MCGASREQQSLGTSHKFCDPYLFVDNEFLQPAGRNGHPLNWSARQKIAVGAARGLRYLHEECRVGCIVHRDLRPNNILLTHDFEPLVCVPFVRFMFLYLQDSLVMFWASFIYLKVTSFR